MFSWYGSFSKLSTYERCNRAYFLKYIKEEPYNTPESELGKKVHSLLAEYLKNNIIIDESLTGFITNYVRHIKSYYNIVNDNIEKKLTFKVGEYDFVGYVDLILPNDISNTIIDWKTSWISDYTDSRQLLLYAYGLLQNDIPVNELKFVYLRTNEMVNVDMNMDNINSVVDWANKTAQEIADKTFMSIDDNNNSEYFPMTNSTHDCLVCPYKNICHSHINIDISSIADEVNMLEEQLKLKKDILRRYIQEFGEIQTNKGTWKFTDVTNWDFDIEKVYNKLVELNVNPLEYLSATATNLKKVLNENQLSEIGIPKKTVKLNFYKAKKAKAS